MTITTSVVGGLATSAPGESSNAVPVESMLHDKNLRLRAAAEIGPFVTGLIEGLSDFGPEAFFDSSPVGGAEVPPTLLLPTAGFAGAALTSGRS